MIEFYKAKRILADGLSEKTIHMFKFRTGNFRIVNNLPQEDILEGEVDEATIKSYPKEYEAFLLEDSKEIEIPPYVEEEKIKEDIAPEITRASFFDEENDEQKEQEIFIKGK